MGDHKVKPVKKRTFFKKRITKIATIGGKKNGTATLAQTL
jgi:hypothetical protein